MPLFSYSLKKISFRGNFLPPKLFIIFYFFYFFYNITLDPDQYRAKILDPYPNLDPQHGLKPSHNFFIVPNCFHFVQTALLAVRQVAKLLPEIGPLSVALTALSPAFLATIASPGVLGAAVLAVSDVLACAEVQGK